MPRNTQVALGETATLECAPPKGRPEPTISWNHKGHPVNMNDGRVKMTGHNLIISDVTHQDEGHYQCIAKNLIGERDSPPAILKVLGMLFT